MARRKGAQATVVTPIIRVNPSTYDLIREYAAEMNLSISEAASEALSDWLGTIGEARKTYRRGRPSLAAIEALGRTH